MTGRSEDRVYIEHVTEFKLAEIQAIADTAGRVKDSDPMYAADINLLINVIKHLDSDIAELYTK